MEQDYNYVRCTRPVQKDYHKGGQLIACGYCPACQYNERVGWTFRVSEESKQAKEAWFITLTYDNENIPLWDTMYDTFYRGMQNNSSNRYESLNDKDLITFINSVKKAQARAVKEVAKNSLSPAEALAPRRPKYYAVGEYGSQYGRPHYHIIFFNIWESIANEINLEKIWKKGRVETESISPALIHYATGYIHEKSSYKKSYQQKPKMYCSKGIGEDYIKRNKKWHKDLLNPWIWFNGYKIGMPKYYKDKIFTSEELEIIQEKLSQFHAQEEPVMTKAHYENRVQSEYSINSRTRKHKKL